MSPFIGRLFYIYMSEAILKITKRWCTVNPCRKGKKILKITKEIKIGNSEIQKISIKISKIKKQIIDLIWGITDCCELTCYETWYV